MPLEIDYRPFRLPPEPPRAVRVSAVAPVKSTLAPVAPQPATPSQPSAGERLSRLAQQARGWFAASSQRQRIGGVVAVGLLGAILGVIGWGSTGIAPVHAEPQILGLQPFEQPGESFPGSAFYYLDPQDSGLVDAKAATQIVAGQTDEEARIGAISQGIPLPQTGGAGPIARPTFFTGSGEDRARALQCLTTAIYYEAASEPDPGQRAVAQVILNRVAHPAFPKTVCGVVYQGSERPGCQFSFACDGSLARRPAPAFWDRARRVAADALSGNVFAPVGLATHYHTHAVHPKWDAEMQMVEMIGNHRFFRWPGLAGRPSSFSGRYVGNEPIPAPHAPVFSPAKGPDLASDPMALARAFEEGRQAALRQVAAGASGATGALIDGPAGAAPTAAAFGQQRRTVQPDYSAELRQRGGDAATRASNLPMTGSGAVRPEYENAGRWIAAPTQ